MPRFPERPVSVAAGLEGSAFRLGLLLFECVLLFALAYVAFIKLRREVSRVESRPQARGPAQRLQPAVRPVAGHDPGRVHRRFAVVCPPPQGRLGQVPGGPRPRFQGPRGGRRGQRHPPGGHPAGLSTCGRATTPSWPTPRRSTCPTRSPTAPGTSSGSPTRAAAPTRTWPATTRSAGPSPSPSWSASSPCSSPSTRSRARRRARPCP